MLRELPSEARLPLRVYRLLFPIVFLLFLPGAVVKMFRRGGYRAQFGQRFGRYDEAAAKALAPGGWTWIHAVSVGEMFMALKLARALQEERPDLRILLSVTTTTGFALAQAQRQSLPCEVELIYYPLDLTSIVRRTLDLIRPEQVVLVDKELWPNFVSECYQRQIPITVVNARISPRSERRIRKAKRWVAPFYGLLSEVCLQDESDRTRWEAVGVRPEALRFTGSLKFDAPAAAFDKAGLEPLRQYLTALQVGEGPVLLGGSTFVGEEELLGRVALRLRERFPGLFLIVVPRHAERSAQVASALERMGLRVARRSEPPTGERPDLLLVDTTGELARWYALASLCFIGKSLFAENSGGQNPSEPLHAGCPVLFGPRMQNFEPLVSQLLAEKAATVVTDAEALEREVAAHLVDPARGAAEVARGRSVLAAHRGATARIVSAITSRSPMPSPSRPAPQHSQG